MKKLLLSFIGLIGILEKCAFVSGTAAVLDDTCTNFSSATNVCSSDVQVKSKEYCFNTNTLYEIITDSNDAFCKTVKITLESGINVFKVDTDITKLSLTETIADADVGKLAMYNCTGTGQNVTCNKADGYVKIGNDYFTIGTLTGTDASAKITGSGYYLLSAGATSTTDLILCNTGNCNTATKSNGFFVNDKDVYECTASSCNKQTPNEVNSCTGDANKVIKDTGNSNKLKYCANTDSTALELSSSTVEGYITKSGDNITILKTIPFAVTTVASATGYFIVDTNKLTSCSTTNNVVTCTEPSSTVLGYYKVTDTTYKTSVQYIKCDSSGCAPETPASATGIASLISSDSKIKLRITGDSNDPLPEFKASDTKYMISIATANAFSSTAVPDNFVLISITDTAITVSDSSGYYITSATTNELVSVKDTEGTLYTCNSNKCTATASDNLTATDIGYYKNGDTNDLYIKCYEKETANTFKCETIESPANTVTCGSGTIGQLVKDGKFCLDGSKEATFETTTGNTKMYQLSYSATSFFASTVTEEGTYGIVEVTTNTIKLKSTAFTDGACVSTSTLEVTDKATCTEGTEENCKGFTASSNFCYYDCVNSTGKNCLEGRYYLFDKTNTDTLVTSTNDGTLVKCKASGACDPVTDVVGYFVNSDFGTKSTKSHIKCAEASGAIKCELYAPSDACDATLIGQLSTDTPDSFCFGGTSVIKKGFATSADDENARYLLEYDASSPFSSVIPNGKSGIIKIGKYDVTLDTDYQSDYGVCTNDSTLVVTERTSATDCASGSTKTGFCSGGICFNPCQVSATTRDTATCLDDNYYLVKDATSSIPIMDETTSGSLYLCETGGTGACTAVTTVGYYLNSKEEAFICETSNNALGCKRMNLPTGCLAATIGQPIIDTDAYFCLDYVESTTTATKSGIMADASSVSKNHLLGYKEGNIFGITENHYGLISVTKSSVTLIDKSGYCLGDKTALTSLAASSAEGKLYNCVNGICEAVPDTDTTMAVGYYKNIGSLAPGDVDYIEFTTATSGGSITKTFKALSITGAASATCSTAGTIILDSGTSKYTMCLTDSIGIELGVEANNGQYFVDVTVATVFGAKTTADTHAIIDISGDNVTLHANETGVERYRYGSATTQKLIDFTATADQTTYCPANADLTSTTIEFSLIDEEEGDTTNYYKKLAYPQAAP